MQILLWDNGDVLFFRCMAISSGSLFSEETGQADVCTTSGEQRGQGWCSWHPCRQWLVHLLRIRGLCHAPWQHMNVSLDDLYGTVVQYSEIDRRCRARCAVPTSNWEAGNVACPRNCIGQNYR